MRRVWPALLAFLGVACITAAIAFPGYLAPTLRSVPLDIDTVTDATSVPADGSAGERYPATIFDRCSVSQKTARTLSAQLTDQRRTLTAKPSDRRQTTLQSADTIRIDRTRDASGKADQPAQAGSDDDRKCGDALLDATIDRVSLSRKTAVPNGTISALQLAAAPEGSNINDASVQLPNRRGFQYRFGFDVHKRDYLYFDTSTRQDVPARYTAEKTIDGVKTYEFDVEAPETDLSSLPDAQNQAPIGTMITMGASWWGIKGKGVKPDDKITMHRYGTEKRKLWVEPRTGTIVDSQSERHQYFKTPDDSADTPKPVRDFRLDALKASFHWSDSTVSQQASSAKSDAGTSRLVGFWLPLILGIVGALLVIAWVLITWGRRRRRGTDPDGTDPHGTDLDTVDGRVDEYGHPVDDPEATTVLPAGAVAADAPTQYLGEAGDNGHLDQTDHSAYADDLGGAYPDADHRPEHAAQDPADTDAYLWERPTQQIPRVEDDVPSGDTHGDDASQFRPLHDDGPLEHHEGQHTAPEGSATDNAAPEGSATDSPGTRSFRHRRNLGE